MSAALRGARAGVRLVRAPSPRALPAARWAWLRPGVPAGRAGQGARADALLSDN